VCVCVCVQVCRLDHLSVGLPESVLWQNGRVDSDSVLGGEWGRSTDGVFRAPSCPEIPEMSHVLQLS